jgi:hypothetical protein
MRPVKAEFGRCLLSRKTRSGGGVVWVVLGVLLVAAGLLFLREIKSTRSWQKVLSDGDRAWWVIGGLGVASVCLGVRRFQSGGSAQHFYDTGACHERDGRREKLAYADVETVTYSVRTLGTRLERTLEFGGPGGQPQFRLWTTLDDGEAGDGKATTAADVQNVASRVAKAVAERMIEWVGRGAAVRWTDQLGLTPEGLRLGGTAAGDIVPWTAIDGVKDGSRTGRIEVYAFGGTQPVATAQTRDVNALPGYHAFMGLIERAQKKRAA